MTPKVRARVFEPFFTTKGISRGTGLGLSVVHGIVTQSGGTIDIASEVGVGTTIRISLPAVETGVTGASAAGANVGGGAETILLVEDEASVRQMAVRVLERAGYTVKATAGGDEALAMLSRESSPVDVLLTDVVMPGMDGRELSERVRKVRPEIKVIYTSGYTDDAVMRHGIQASEVTFLQKPYVPRELLRKVRVAVDGG
jgi:CheY-like chemotaxis protein